MRIRALTTAFAIVLPLTQVPAPALALDPKPAESATVAGQVLVGLASDIPETATSPVLADLAAEVGASSRQHLPIEDVVSLEVPPAQVDEIVERLAEDPRVAWAAPDVLVEADLAPDDPYWPQQWGPAKVGLPTAWDATSGSRDVVIAVLDTGVDATSPEFAGRLLPGYDLVNDDPDPADDHGHGTSAASVAAAGTDDGTGAAGACGSCTILPVKVLGPDGRGAVSTVATGVSWAVSHGADVINLSLGTPSSHPALAEAVAAAQAAGVIVVASAGNEGTTAFNYPAALPGVVGVVGTDGADQRYPWSSYGAWTDVAAPGCNHAAALSGAYVEYCGTSSAAPLVAGVVGLGLSTGASATAVVDALSTTAVAVGNFTASGRIDAGLMIARLAGLPAPVEEPPTAEPSPSESEDGTPDGQPTAPDLFRVAGASRYETAVEAAQQAFPDGAEIAYVATGGAFPDALAAGPAAAVGGGPVLLTDPAALPAAVRDELARLRPDRIVVAGGSRGVSDAVISALGQIAPVRRLAGADRYSTAAAIAQDTFTGPVPVVYLASGEAFADALAGGPAAAIRGGPLLLVRPGALPAATADALRHLQPAEIVVLGGRVAVSEAVAQEVAAVSGATVRRIAGADRAGTAAAVAMDTHPDGADVVYLATGRTFPDALAGGAVAGHLGAPLLLADSSALPTATSAALRGLGASRLIVLGGEQALPGNVVDAALSALTETAATRP